MAISLAACHQPVREIRAFPDGARAQAGIGEINVTTDAPSVTPAIVANLKAALEEISRTCGDGPSKYALDVRLENFKGMNAAAAILVGDSTQLAGFVRLTNTQTRDVVGEYYFDEVRAGGGLIGIAVMSGAATTLPKAFANRVCSDILRRKVPTAPSGTPHGENVGGEKSYTPN
jgi:hypothetical protein